eukprot:CAMPEP_0181311104 /NCGR_PEP_ID=MMETSP1101-20121128/12952_1 /TAXON_ID=46948 /ORGANISM="Rhodomonas abbreviata, Strain Caron Lab Isolate" /LENGTH=63 /DNA_ID=CAMNT_0023417799 /DNA_START=524 /DNA_END=715 /DNA_ORIENTATION=+
MIIQQTPEEPAITSFEEFEEMPEDAAIKVFDELIQRLSTRDFTWKGLKSDAKKTSNTKPSWRF